MKKLLLVLFVAFAIVGCSATETGEVKADSSNFQFEIIYEQKNKKYMVQIIENKKTGTQYMFYRQFWSENTCGFTELNPKDYLEDIN